MGARQTKLITVIGRNTALHKEMRGTMNAFDPAFMSEVERVRESGLVGSSGRLRELFDFLASRGPQAEPASQIEIAETVVGQAAAEPDDATARVYVHRLRKRLEQFYQSAAPGAGRLVLPAGIYALRFEPGKAGAVHSRRTDGRLRVVLLPLILLLAVVGAFFGGRAFSGTGAAAPVNAIWRPFIESERPTLVVVGDYYIFGKFNPNRPEVDRMERDFAINSKTDLARAQEANPQRYGDTEDMGLSYLPVSSAYALRALMPVISQARQPVTIMPASQVDSDLLRNRNVIYVGLISGMGMIQDVNFTDSNFAVGDSYDELVDMISGRRFTSGEALALPTAQYYDDYGYIARFKQPGGALIGIIAGERDTGLRGVAPLSVATTLPENVKQLAAGGKPFEALYEITGQQGTDLGAKLVEVRPRP